MRQEYREECFPALRDFLGYMEVVKGRSVNTVEEYFIDLRTFFRYIKQCRGLVPASMPEEKIPIADVDIPLIRSVTLQDVFEFMSYAKNERGNHAKALAQKASSLRVFFRYLTNYTHQLDYNPVQNLDTPKVHKSLPKYLTVEQSIDLLQSVDGEYAQRDYCMLTLLLNCGLRRAELAGLNLSDIRSDNTLRVLGKGNKERIIYLNDACLDALAQYLPTRPVDGVEKSERDALFYSRLKKRISLQGIHFIVKGYLARVQGLDGYSTHKLRHTAATLMYQNGVDIRVLQEFLGHENLNTTEIYTHLSSDQIKNASKANPLANIKSKKRRNPYTLKKDKHKESEE